MAIQTSAAPQELTELTPAGGENATRKRIQLVIGERASIWGPPREIALDTFRTDLR